MADTMSDVEFGGPPLPDPQRQQELRDRLQRLLHDGSARPAALLEQSWDVIEPAVYEQQPDETAALEDVSPLLSRVAGMHARRDYPEERAKIDAGITLASWGTIGDLAIGQPPSEDSFTEGQQTLGAMLTDLTWGTHLLSHDSVSRRTYTKIHEILGIALTNRLRDPRLIMLPSAPSKHHGYQDSQGRPAAHNAVLVRKPDPEVRIKPVLIVPHTIGINTRLTNRDVAIVPIGEIAKTAIGDETPPSQVGGAASAFHVARLAATSALAECVALEAEGASLTDAQQTFLDTASLRFLESI